METRDIFQRAAKVYDTPERIRVANIIAGEIRRELTDTQYRCGMDYGCGTGLVGLALMDLFDALLFVDTAPQMIEQVQEKLQRTGVKGAQTMSGDFCAEVPAGIGVDCIFMSQVLLHVKEYKTLLPRLYDMLNPRGGLIIVDFDKNEKVNSDLVHNSFVQAELSALLTQLGFSSVISRTFYHGEKIFMNQDASIFLMHAVK